MGAPAAKKGDLIQALDTHLIQLPSSPSPVSMSMPFKGIIDGELSSNVRFMGQFAATEGSTASNIPPHMPSAGTFVKVPSNKGKIKSGSSTVRINGKAAARSADVAQTCNDPNDLTNGLVIAVGTVLIGG